MLPARSKRFANTENGDLPRLKLTENWQLLVIACIMLGLFVAIFPRQALVQKLYGERKFDELTLFYIDNLRRTEPDNPDIAILLARAREQQMDVAGMENLLVPVIAHGSDVQQHEARMLLIDRYTQTLQRPSATQETETVRGKLLALLDIVSKAQPAPAEARALARAAFQVQQPARVVHFLKFAAGKEMLAQLMEYGQLELGLGHYERAADYFFLARQQATQADEARALFKQGVAALMANSLYAQVLQRAEQNMGDLANDAETLRYMVQTARAAGEARRAAEYARRLIFGNEPAELRS